MMASAQLREFIATFDLAPDHPWMGLLEEEVGELEVANDEDDRLAIARELADVVYVAHGMAQAHGIDLDVALDAVHAANMAKLVDGRAIRRRDGKIMKPKQWTPPDLTPALEGSR